MERLLGDYPDTTGGIGIDSRVARTVQHVLSSDTPLSPSRRNARENYGFWTQEMLREYQGWLSNLLGIEIGGDAAPPSLVHWERASKVNIGPCESHIFNRFEHGKRQLDVELGFTFLPQEKDKPLSEWTAIGRAWADRLGRRPSRQELDEAHKNGEFLSHYVTVQAYGSISNFYEQIGYPSFKRTATRDDVLDWGVAFKRQNGPQAILTPQVIRSFKGRAPGISIVYRDFESVPNFDFAAHDAYHLQVSEEENRRQAEMNIAQSLLASNPGLASRAEGMTEQQLRRFVAQYRLIKVLVDYVRDSHCVIAAASKSTSKVADADKVCDWILGKTDGLTRGRIELEAIKLNIYDTLWPTPYRFQNVDLRLPSTDDARILQADFTTVEPVGTQEAVA